MQTKLQMLEAKIDSKSNTSMLEHKLAEKD